MQLVSSRIWTRVAVSISYDDNHYTTGTSITENMVIGISFHNLTLFHRIINDESFHMPKTLSLTFFMDSLARNCFFTDESVCFHSMDSDSWNKTFIHRIW